MSDRSRVVVLFSASNCRLLFRLRLRLRLRCRVRVRVGRRRRRRRCIENDQSRVAEVLADHASVQWISRALCVRLVCTVPPTPGRGSRVTARLCFREENSS